jgi:hypothetical protein
MKRILIAALLLLTSCGNAEVGPTRPAVNDAPLVPLASATPTAQETAASVMNHRQVLFRLRFRRIGQPQVTQKQIDNCLGPGYSLIIDRVIKARGEQPEFHALYLKIPKTVAVAGVATKLETLPGVEEIRLR